MKECKNCGKESDNLKLDLCDECLFKEAHKGRATVKFKKPK